MRPLMTLAVLASTLALSASASAASFDCARARAPDERAICDSRALNDQDVRLGVLYEVNSRTLAMGGRGALLDGQRLWLAERRRCGADRRCLSRAYARRVGELERLLDRIYSNGPF